MNDFDIIEYLSGLTEFVFDKAVLKRVALDRDVNDVSDYEELDNKTKDLLRADLLYIAYVSPNVWAGISTSHGSFSKSIGGQTLSGKDKERLYNIIYYIYEKYDDEKLDELKNNNASLQWLDIE